MWFSKKMWFINRKERKIIVNRDWFWKGLDVGNGSKDVIVVNRNIFLSIYRKLCYSI